jgi:iron complex outermembrane receptor protein
VGFRWQPDNQVLIRASWGKGFRAPDISELFSGQSESFPFALDPCNYGLLPTEPAQTATRCAAAGVPVGVYTQPTNGELSNVLVGGNPHLNPETSVSRTVGFVVNPNAVPGLTVNADYFKINVNDIISTISAQNILNGCYIGGVSSFCDLVHRNGTGIITSLIDTETNVGDVVTEGIDFGGSYGFDTRLGRFNIAVQSTYTTEYNEIVPNGTGGTVTYHLAGWEDGSSYLSYPKDKTILTTTWSRGDWAALWRMRYIGSMLEDCTGFTSYGVCSDPNPNHYSYTGQSKIPTNELGSTVYNDASVTYAIDLINSKITLGVNNLLNRNPPVSYTAHNLSFDPTTYDIPGRFIYLSLTANF